MHTDQTCECCGYSDHYAGVASSAIPYSAAWCGVCLAMGAQPGLVFASLDLDPKQCTTMAHFDRERDQYFLGEEHLPILMKDGSAFNTRQEFSAAHTSGG